MRILKRFLIFILFILLSSNVYGIGIIGPSPIQGIQWSNVPVNLIPTADGTYDLGSSSKEWEDLYIDGTANIDSLIADTADINGGTIDDVIITDSPISGSGDVEVTGTISGGIGVISKSSAYTLGTDDTNEEYGYSILATSAMVLTLGATGVGKSGCIYSTTAAEISVDANASDRFIFNGIALSDGAKVTSPGNAGDEICWQYESGNGWVTRGKVGLWTDGGV